MCHRCDNPLCVRPDHLFLGTNADNMSDMARKGRSQIGVRHHGAKLTESDVAMIRAERAKGSTLKDIAARHGVTFQTISKIANGYSWTHLATTA